MSKIVKSSKQSNTTPFVGKNLVKLPHIFGSIFTNPKYSEAALDLLIRFSQAGYNNENLRLPKHSDLSYIKNTVVPFLASLTVKEGFSKAKIFDHIHYNVGKASVSYRFSSQVKRTFYVTHERELKNGTKRASEGSIIVNTDEFFALRGLYTKQLYLRLCAWRKGQALDLFRGGKKSIFAAWQLPKSYEKSLISEVLKPAVGKINAYTRFHIIEIKASQNKFTIIYKRLKKRKQSSVDVVVNRHPHIPMSAKEYRATLFYERRFSPKASANLSYQQKTLPYMSIEEYVSKLVREGFGETDG